MVWRTKSHASWVSGKSLDGGWLLKVAAPAKTLVGKHVLARCYGTARSQIAYFKYNS